MLVDLLIKGGYVYNTLSGKLNKFDVAIKDGKIIQVAEDISPENSDRIVNAENKVIMPGFINAHVHFGEFYAKGYSGKLTTPEYIDYTEKFNSLNVGKKEEIRKSSTILCVYESLSYGSTTLVGIRGWDCLEKYPIRVFMGYPLMNSEKLKDYLKKPFEQFEKRKNNELNTYYIFLHSLPRVNEKILRQLSKYIKTRDVKLAVHIDETMEESREVRKKYDGFSMEVMAKYGLLSQNTLLVHGCVFSGEDYTIARKHNCSTCICPNSNLKLDNQIASAYLIREKINVCIGTDGSATNDSLGLLDSCKTLGLLSTVETKELIKMITVNPAKYLDIKAGQIKKGYLADIQLYDLNDYRIVRKETFINNLIYSSDILPSHVIISGKVVINEFENQYITKADLQQIKIPESDLKYK